VTDGVEPPVQQPTLTPSDPSLVTNSSPPEAKLALFARMFAARRDVYARYWENSRKGTKGWAPVVRDAFGKGSLWERRPLPLIVDALPRRSILPTRRGFPTSGPVMNSITAAATRLGQF